MEIQLAASGIDSESDLLRSPNQVSVEYSYHDLDGPRVFSVYMTHKNKSSICRVRCPPGPAQVCKDRNLKADILYADMFISDTWRLDLQI